MLMLKKLSISLLLVATTFSLIGCGSGETSYSLADLQQLADTNASNNESPKDKENMKEQALALNSLVQIPTI